MRARLKPAGRQPRGAIYTGKSCYRCGGTRRYCSSGGCVTCVLADGVARRRARRAQSSVPALAACIGCGCDDNHACSGGCTWLVVDRDAGLGVCSACPEDLPRWHAGDRSLPDGMPG